NQPVLLSTSMESLLSDSVADRRFIMSLLAVTGCFALLMAAAGVYGVTLYTASRRIREFGIRMALGATPAKIHNLVFRQAFAPVAVGLAIGLVSALALMRILGGVLEGLHHVNPLYVLLAACMVSFTAGTACWVPARRATRNNPMSALQLE